MKTKICCHSSKQRVEAHCRQQNVLLRRKHMTWCRRNEVVGAAAERANKDFTHRLAEFSFRLKFDNILLLFSYYYFYPKLFSLNDLILLCWNLSDKEMMQVFGAFWVCLEKGHYSRKPVNESLVKNQNNGSNSRSLTRLYSVITPSSFKLVISNIMHGWDLDNMLYLKLVA